jgi:hypothetical protein
MLRAAAHGRRVVVVPQNPDMVWWRVDCPVRPLEQDWIERSMDWLMAQFGTERLHGEVVLPTDDYFPGAYRGTRQDIQAVLERLCTHMDIDPARVQLQHQVADDNPELSAHVPLDAEWTGAAGHHRIRDGRSVVGIRDDQAARPMALVATIAHELGHVLLLGDGRISAQQQDHEPLTDLLTIFFGLGILQRQRRVRVFARNPRRIRLRPHQSARLSDRTHARLGLARYAWLRGEADPRWARYLDTNPRTILKRGLRHLAQADQTR